MVHYLEVPVLLQFRDNEMKDDHGYILYVNAGPYIAFALDDQSKPNLLNIPAANKKNDWGATIGVGMQTPICGKDIRFDLRYDLGLAEIANQPTDYRTKALNFTVGISL